jgi:hypothetical protein
MRSGKFWLTAGLLAAASVVLLSPPVRAQSVTCDQLLEDAARSGESPGISISSARATVTLMTSRWRCTESLAKFSGRKLDPNWARGDETSGSGDDSSSDDRSGSKRYRSVRCDKHPRDFWTAMTLEIDGAEYWLAKVFTLDLDGDGHADNIGFRLRSHEGQDRTLRYRTRGKKLSASDFPKLRLPDEQLISRMCPSSVSFREPIEEALQVAEESKEEKDQKGFSVPDLAKQSRRVGAPTEAVKRPEGKTWKTPVWLWIGGGVAIALLVLGGVVVVLLMGRRKATDDDDDDDEDYDDEED